MPDSSVGSLEAIEDRLRHKSWWIANPEARVVEWADAEAAVREARAATVQEIAAFAATLDDGIAGQIAARFDRDQA